MFLLGDEGLCVWGGGALLVSLRFGGIPPLSISLSPSVLNAVCCSLSQTSLCVCQVHFETGLPAAHTETLKKYLHVTDCYCEPAQ